MLPGVALAKISGSVPAAYCGLPVPASAALMFPLCHLGPVVLPMLESVEERVLLVSPLEDGSLLLEGEEETPPPLLMRGLLLLLVLPPWFLAAGLVAAI